MVNNMIWVACVSQTGSELVNICKKMDIKPDAILTTNRDRLVPEAFDLAPVYVTKGRPTEEQYEYFFRGAKLITLHGFLYIIPKGICEQLREAECRVYNGHPALLARYPELKGKDKQEDAFYQKDRYPYMGSVIHECIAELDAGRILIACERSNDCESVEDAYGKLKETSFETWLYFFNRLFDPPGYLPWDYPGVDSWNYAGTKCSK